MKTEIAFAMTSPYADDACGAEAHGFQDYLYVEVVNNQPVFSVVSYTPYECNYEYGMTTAHDRTLEEALDTPIVRSSHPGVHKGMTIREAIEVYKRTFNQHLKEQIPMELQQLIERHNELLLKIYTISFSSEKEKESFSKLQAAIDQAKCELIEAKALFNISKEKQNG